jgi:RNase P subunit RPR2
MSLQQSSPETKMTTICLECGSGMSISAVGPTLFGNAHENIAYSCKNCGKVQTYTIETRR